MRVLIAGLAGASLGTEILKCLTVVEGYEVFGCDISPLAYGLYDSHLQKAFVVDPENYIESVIANCIENKIEYILPGGEQPMVLLAKGNDLLKKSGIKLVSNSSEIIGLFSDKGRTFQFLESHGFTIPRTVVAQSEEQVKDFSFPCIVKPSSGTGGSDSVFLATNLEECILYVELLSRNGRVAIVQEYIDLGEGEFTIGVLSDTHGNVLGSVAMQRVFNSKLSIAYKGKKGLISSGYSQGLIADFPDLRRQAEQIAISARSTGPLNIQGRVRNGVLIPFEINPRFSASTYLRTLAGFNEVHFYLQHILQGKSKFEYSIKEGYYLRTFNELYIPKTEL